MREFTSYISKVFNTCIMQNGSVSASSLVASPSCLIPRSRSDAVKSIAPLSVNMLKNQKSKQSETVSLTVWDRWYVATVTERCT